MQPILGNDLLQGDLVILKKPTPADLYQFAAWTHDVEYFRLRRAVLFAPASAEHMIAWAAAAERTQEEIPFSIYALSDNRLIGILVINHIQWAARHCSFYIGIGSSADRGQGFGTDAVRVLLKFAFLEMSLNAVRLGVISYNPRAIRAYEKVGFKLDGTLRATVYRDGVYYDTHEMSILRREWEALYGFPPVSYPEAT